MLPLELVFAGAISCFCTFATIMFWDCVQYQLHRPKFTWQQKLLLVQGGYGVTVIPALCQDWQRWWLISFGLLLGAALGVASQVFGWKVLQRH